MDALSPDDLNDFAARLEASFPPPAGGIAPEIEIEALLHGETWCTIWPKARPILKLMSYIPKVGLIITGLIGLGDAVYQEKTCTPPLT